MKWLLRFPLFYCSIDRIVMWDRWVSPVASQSGLKPNKGLGIRSRDIECNIQSPFNCIIQFFSKPNLRVLDIQASLTWLIFGVDHKEILSNFAFMNTNTSIDISIADSSNETSTSVMYRLKSVSDHMIPNATLKIVGYKNCGNVFSRKIGLALLFDRCQ